MFSPHLLNTPHLGFRLGVNHLILSPGSRSAPLPLAFVRYPNITAKVISDKRSAAFIGLDKVQQLQYWSDWCVLWVGDLYLYFGDGYQ